MLHFPLSSAEGAEPNLQCEESKNQTALHIAASTGNLAIAHLLIQVEYAKPIASVLLVRCHLPLSLQAGAVTNLLDTDLRTPLMTASEKGFIGIVQFLTKSGAEPMLKVQLGHPNQRRTP